MTKAGRQAATTRERLQQALIELIAERGYAAITIQAIVGRAGVGRTTFYLHYHNKDELFLGCHEAVLSQYQIAPHPARARYELLSLEAPPGMAAAYRHLTDARGVLSPILRSKDGLLILRQFRDRNAQSIEASLAAAFAGADSAIPLSVLANYLAGAQVALLQWWLEKRPPLDPEVLAGAFHRLQRAAICEAFGFTAGT